MKLLYTGAPNFDQQQKNPIKSIGGYISSTPIDNGGLNNLFGSISQSSLFERSTEYRALALYNDSDEEKLVRIFYKNLSTQPLTTIKMGLQAVGQDSCQGKYLTKLSSVYNSPSAIIFSDNRENNNGLNITIQPNTYIGLWIERSINAVAAKDYLDCDNMIQRHKSSEEKASFDISIVQQNISQKYFEFNTLYSNIYVWYNNVSQNYTHDPVLIQGKESIKVDVEFGDSLEQLTDKTIAVLQQTLQQRQEITVNKINNNTLNIQMTESGHVILPSPGNSSVNIQNQNTGSSNSTELIEKIDLILQY